MRDRGEVSRQQGRGGAERRERGASRRRSVEMARSMDHGLQCSDVSGCRGWNVMLPMLLLYFGPGE